MSQDKPCAICGHVFKWGADADSGLGIQAAGKTCGENAYWKLQGHMVAEHPEALFVCPRAGESFGPLSKTPAFWEADDTCSYCGSLKPEILLKAIEEGTALLGATDKNYKLYVGGLPDPDAGKPTIYSSANHDPKRDDWVLLTEEIADEHQLNSYDRTKIGSWVKIEPRRATVHHKFYFQHFDQAQRERFVELYNANRMSFEQGGSLPNVARGFPRLPFFMVPASKDAAA